MLQKFISSNAMQFPNTPGVIVWATLLLTYKDRTLMPIEIVHPVLEYTMHIKVITRNVRSLFLHLLLLKMRIIMSNTYTVQNIVDT